MYFFGNKTEGQGGLGGGGGTAHLTSHESILLGYLPIRDDFEVEYDNEAESLVSHLIHLPNSSQSGTQSQASRGSTEGGPGGGEGLALEGDLDLENELKVAQVEMYKSRLRQRERRKKVVRGHTLISNFFRENPITYDHRGHAMLSAPKVKKSASNSSASGGGVSGGTNKDLTSPEALEKMKLLAEFQSVPEFQAFMANINKV